MAESTYHRSLKPGEFETYAVDFTGDLASGDRISTATVTGSSDGATAMLTGGLLIEATDGLIVSQLFEAVAAEEGRTHKFTFTVETAGGETYIAELHITVGPSVTLAAEGYGFETLGEGETARPTLFTFAELNRYAKREFSALEYNEAEAFTRSSIEGYCKRIFASREFTEEVEVLSKDVTLGNWPVTDITSITTGWTDPGETTEVYAVSTYRRRAWGVQLAARPAAHFLTVVYTAGEPSVPADIKWVALTIAKERLLPRERPEGVSSLSSDGVNYSFNLAGDDKPTGNDRVDAILNRWRLAKVRIG